MRLLDLRVEELCQQLFALIYQHVGAWPALASPVLGWLPVVNLCLLVSDHTHACVIELHPLTLTLYDGVVVAELQALSLVDDHAFKMVDFGPAFHVLYAHLFWERNPKIKFLLHECLWVDAEALEMHEENFRVVTNDYFFGGNLACQTSLTRQLVVLIEQFLERKASHALNK